MYPANLPGYVFYSERKQLCFEHIIIFMIYTALPGIFTETEN